MQTQPVDNLDENLHGYVIIFYNILAIDQFALLWYERTS